jgi:Helicase conserved C-terminal domain
MCYAPITAKIPGRKSEGINLQFCWFMVKYDIPWNPVRLEQRMGRIHRYGQEHDCLIFNFVAANTREGRVLAKLLDRLPEIRSELGTDQVFDVVGEHVGERGEDGLVEQLVTQSSVEAFDEGILLRFAWRDVVPFDMRRL